MTHFDQNSSYSNRIFIQDVVFSDYFQSNFFEESENNSESKDIESKL